MEFVPGRSLEKILEDSKAPLDEDQVITWMMQVCEALSYIHSRTPPIILRDLKPGNVMVTPDGNVQLIDFGIARRFDPNKRTNTENLGTISYASPEHLGSITAPGQRRSAHNPGRLVQTDARSDIYSLGATMYHLLTNYEPDPIQTPAPGSIRAKNPRLRTVQTAAGVVCPVERVIIKAMQQDPAQRFQNAEAMRVALQSCLPSTTPASTIQIPAISPNATIVVPAAAFNSANSGVNGLICPRCGFQNRPGAKFCKRDGQPLTQGAKAVPPQARVQYAARAPIQARPIASQPIRARPVAVSAPPAGDPVTATRSGLQYLNNKNYVEAINQFKLALSLGKASYDVLYNLGRAYRQYGQSVREKNKKLFSENLKLAAEQFEQAIRLKADALDAFFQLGMSYRDLALYAQASATFNRAQQLAPNDPAIYYQLGMVAMEQGYNRDAEKYFQQGLKITPDHALILTSLGHLYIRMSRLKLAISTLLQATQREPALPEGWYELGRAYMETREWQLALKAFDQVLQLNPDASTTYSAMASCYLKMNKRSEARQRVDQALQLDQNNA